METWPPGEGHERKLSLAAGGRLELDTFAARSGGSGTDTLTVDFTHSATYGTEGTSRWFMLPPGAPDSLMVRNRPDRCALVWETQPLEEELTVVGHPIFEVTLGANRPAVDLFVYFSDVGPDGRVVNVTERQLRMNFHRTVDRTGPLDQQIEIRPMLSRYGFRSSEHVEAPLADGRTIETVVALLPTAWTFQQGHRIRVSVTGADAGNSELHPALCPAETGHRASRHGCTFTGGRARGPTWP